MRFDNDFLASARHVTGQLMDVAERSHLTDSRELLRGLRRLQGRASASQWTVALFADTESRKTSLLHTLLGASPEAAGTYPGAGSCTYFGYGAEPECSVTLANGLTARLPLPQLTEFLQEKVPVFGLLKVAVRIPNEKLKTGLVVVDTPVLTAGGQPLAGCTQTALQDAEACVFATAVAGELSSGAEAFLRSARDHVQKMFVVLVYDPALADPSFFENSLHLTKVLRFEYGIDPAKIVTFSTSRSGAIGLAGEIEEFRDNLTQFARSRSEVVVANELRRLSGETLFRLESARGEGTGVVQSLRLRRAAHQVASIVAELPHPPSEDPRPASADPARRVTRVPPAAISQPSDPQPPVPQPPLVEAPIPDTPRPRVHQAPLRDEAPHETPVARHAERVGQPVAPVLLAEEAAVPQPAAAQPVTLELSEPQPSVVQPAAPPPIMQEPITQAFETQSVEFTAASQDLAGEDAVKDQPSATPTALPELLQPQPVTLQPVTLQPVTLQPAALEPREQPPVVPPSVAPEASHQDRIPDQWPAPQAAGSETAPAERIAPPPEKNATPLPTKKSHSPQTRRVVQDRPPTPRKQGPPKPARTMPFNHVASTRDPAAVIPPVFPQRSGVSSFTSVPQYPPQSRRPVEPALVPLTETSASASVELPRASVGVPAGPVVEPANFRVLASYGASAGRDEEDPGQRHPSRTAWWLGGIAMAAGLAWVAAVGLPQRWQIGNLLPGMRSGAARTTPDYPSASDGSTLPSASRPTLGTAGGAGHATQRPHNSASTANLGSKVDGGSEVPHMGPRTASAADSSSQRSAVQPTGEELGDLTGAAEPIQDPSLQYALDRWASTYRSGNIRAQVNCYAPFVDNYFNLHNVRLEQVERDKTDAWSNIAAVHEYKVKPIRVTDDGNGQKTVLLQKDWNTTTRRGTKWSGSEVEKLVFVKIDSSWKIVDEQEMKLLRLHRE